MKTGKVFGAGEPGSWVTSVSKGLVALVLPVGPCTAPTLTSMQTPLPPPSTRHSVYLWNHRDFQQIQPLLTTGRKEATHAVTGDQAPFPRGSPLAFTWLGKPQNLSKRSSAFIPSALWTISSEIPSIPVYCPLLGELANTPSSQATSRTSVWILSFYGKSQTPMTKQNQQTYGETEVRGGRGACFWSLTL